MPLQSLEKFQFVVHYDEFSIHKMDDMHNWIL